MKNKPQLFCFTYAGGNAAFFDAIEQDLHGIDVVKLEYAGHGDRRKEGFYHDFDELADDMFQKFAEKYAGHAYALFGYSMGSISVVEVFKRIVESGVCEPEIVFLAAHEPHTKSELLGFAADEKDDWVKTRTVNFGAVPEKLLKNKVFWRTYLPLYRADYTIIGKYQFEKLRFHTEIPAVIFYSETDTPRDEMELWRKYFSNCAFYPYAGTHFFIQEHHAEMAEIIKCKLGAAYDI